MERKQYSITLCNSGIIQPDREYLGWFTGINPTQIFTILAATSSYSKPESIVSKND